MYFSIMANYQVTEISDAVLVVNIVAVALAASQIIPIVVKMARILLDTNFRSHINSAAQGC